MNETMWQIKCVECVFFFKIWRFKLRFIGDVTLESNNDIKLVTFLYIRKTNYLNNFH